MPVKQILPQWRCCFRHSIAQRTRKTQSWTFSSSIAREVCQNIFLPLADFDPVTLELQPVLIKTIPEGIVVADGAHKKEARQIRL